MLADVLILYIYCKTNNFSETARWLTVVKS